LSSVAAKINIQINGIFNVRRKIVGISGSERERQLVWQAGLVDTDRNNGHVVMDEYVLASHCHGAPDRSRFDSGNQDLIYFIAGEQGDPARAWFAIMGRHAEIWISRIESHEINRSIFPLLGDKGIGSSIFKSNAPTPNP
jgi:hypothetical protein